MLLRKFSINYLSSPLWAALALLICFASIAGAPSALDGFNPNADCGVSIVVQREVK